MKPKSLKKNAIRTVLFALLVIASTAAAAV
ncbi:Uncharacterised protein [Legionella waltersii]|nr:Uncharacterised protein [Legionella waltersii]